ncbi:AAA family ATPase [bacterium]|nr:AAA family ATPase [bacterium]
MFLEELEIINFTNDYGDEIIVNQKLKFGEGINLLIGPNGGGKTTLLKILQACVSFNFNELKEKNDFHFRTKGELENGNFEANFMAKREKLDFSINFTIENDKISIEKNGQNFKILKNGENLVGNVIALGIDFNLQNILRDLSNEVFAQLKFLKFPQFCGRGVEDNSETKLLFEKNIKTFTIYFFEKGSIPFENNLLQEKWSGTENQAEMNEFSFIILKDLTDFINKQGPPKDFREPLNLKLEFKSSFLEKISKDYPFFDSYKISFGSSQISMKSRKFRDGKCIFLKKEREIKIDNVLTWGQKRFVYLLSKVELNEIPLIDEIENGFHPKMVEDLLKKIYEQKKQAFITTHSHNIINNLKYVSMEELGKSVVLCKIGTNEKLAFSNLKGKDLEKVFKKVETEIISLANVLFYDGVWN